MRAASRPAWSRCSATCSSAPQVDPKDVVFLAHSTTQATNALLEGDVAAVGVIGMASRVEAVLARGQSNVKDIELAPGRFLRPSHRFITTDKLDEALVRQTLRSAARRRRAGRRGKQRVRRG